jgi:hypothetical protein
VAWFKGIHDMGYLAARTQAGLGAGYQQDWTLVGLNAGAFAGKGLWYLKDKIKFIEEGLKQEGPVKGPTMIVDLALVAIGIMDLLNGVLAPTTGPGFGEAVTAFDSSYKSLRSAIPLPERWSGDGADAYAAQNAKIMDLVTQMQALDKQMQTHISEHAEKVAKVHQVIAACLLTLVIAQGVALVLWSIPLPVGPPLSTAFQVTTVVATSGVTLAYEGITVHSSIYKSALIDAMAAEYSAVKEQAPIPGTFAKIEVVGADETRVSSFADVSNSMSPMPTLNSLLSAGSPSLSPEEREVIGALTGSDEAPAEAGPPELVEATPPAPVFAPPTLSQISQASGQLAKTSEQASQHMNLANQMMGQVQQVAQMSQQGQGAAAPAEKAATTEDASLAGDVEGAGAGAEGAERAPIDVAQAGSQQTQEPSLAERML